MQAICARVETCGRRYNFPLPAPNTYVGQAASAYGCSCGSPLVVVDDYTDMPPHTKPGEVYTISISPGRNYGEPVLSKISDNPVGLQALLHYMEKYSHVDPSNWSAEARAALNAAREAE